MKPVIVHGAVLALSAVLAAGVWSKSGETKANQGESSVEVWSGRADSLESIGFESATRKVKLEAKKDACRSLLRRQRRERGGRVAPRAPAGRTTLRRRGAGREEARDGPLHQREGG